MILSNRFIECFFYWIAFILTFGITTSALCQHTAASKPRLMILTDIGGDPDDIQSLRRLLVYANEFRVEGIIATATWGEKPHRKLGTYFINEHLIYKAIEDYAQVYSNLIIHHKDFPTPEMLRFVVKGGQKDRGVDNLVPGKSTAGSDHIIARVDASEELLWVTIWGGAHDLAQALLDVRESRTPEELDDFVDKIRVYAIGDQDAKFTQEGTGAWIRENFPDIFYIEAGPQWVRTEAGSSAGYRGMYQNDSRGGLHPILPLVREGGEMNDTEWVTENITPYGPLGAGYPADVNINPNTPRNTTGVKEGDTPSWFYLLPLGFNDPEHPEWGGWGGRFEHIQGRYYTDAQDGHWSGTADGSVRRKWTIARWREAYQNDFAGRIRWCTLPHEKANHNPVAVIDQDSTDQILIRQVKPGQVVDLNARDSYDQDGDSLHFTWWIYHEPSSAEAILYQPYDAKAQLKISHSPTGEEVHVILKVGDSGAPQLYAYRRIIFKVIS